MKVLLEINPLIPYFVIFIPAFVGAYFLFRKRSLKAKMIFLYSACVFGLVLLVLNKGFHYFKYHENFFAQLPLHLCYISLMFMPLALRLKKKVYFDFLFYISALGAFAAMVSPAKDYVDHTWTMVSFTYFLFHFIIVAVPLWLYLWKIYSARLSYANSLKIFAALFSIFAFMHALNLILVDSGIDAANYCWTLVENARYNNPILSYFSYLIPYDFVYLFCAVPILYIYISIWNLSLFFANKDKRLGQKFHLFKKRVLF